jgi:apolipoprotein N-acyltransferase
MLVGLLYGPLYEAIAGYFLLALVSYSVLGVLIFLLACAYVAPFALVENGGAFWLEKRAGLPRAIGYVLLFTLGEKVRTVGDLSAPGDLTSHALGSHPAWLSWSSWGGPYLIPLIACASAALLDLAVESRSRPKRAAVLALAAIGLWMAPVVTHLATAPAPVAEESGDGHGESFRVGLVQPSTPLSDKLDRGRWDDTWRLLERLTLQAAEGADLVIWPETARPGPVLWREGEPFGDPPMEALAARAGVPILYGCEIARVRGRQVVNLYNGAALARPDGSPGDWYGKQHLIPFVEGVPFAGLFGGGPGERKTAGEREGFLTLMGAFTPGPRPTIFEVGPARIGVLVCYESMFPQIVRRYRQEGANALAVITNDAWWGRTHFPLQHALLMGARAREVGLPAARAANSGVCSSTVPPRAPRSTPATATCWSGLFW